MSASAKQENTKESKSKAKKDSELEQKLQEVFYQIDLAQARIDKEQEEIKYLSKETDELFHQLGLKAS